MQWFEEYVHTLQTIHHKTITRDQEITTDSPLIVFWETMADTDDDITIVGTNQRKRNIIVKNGVKSESNSDIEVIEVTESPELIRKRETDNSCQSYDSPINAPKSRVKRVLSDSSDEDSARKQTKTSLNDEIGRMAFEEMCENTIKELQQLFPEIDICEIQDALIQCDWSVFNASIQLGNLYDCPEADKNGVKTETNGVKSEPNICTNDEKMKSLDNYRKWKPNQSKYVFEDDEEVMEAKSFNTIKNNKQKFSKKNFAKFNDSDESSVDSDGGDDYNKNSEGVVCLSTSGEDDSEGESKNGFEEMCENTIKELQQLFPEFDICEIQDALIQCDWSLYNACIQLVNQLGNPSNPRSLKSIARNTIYHAMGRELAQNINKLQLPPSVKQYVLGFLP